MGTDLPNDRRGTWRLLLFCIAAAALFLAICCMSSPLYPMNTWSDVNCFVTMGRGMLEGKVLYRDLYEQKGPLLYFIYALCMGLFPRSFFGMYLMETACFSAFLYYSGKCAGLYLDRRWTVYAILPVLAAVIGASKAFAEGGSVEEMCLFPAIASMYMILRAVRSRAPVPGRDAFVIGVFASAVFWIKYTLCGLYIGLALFVALYYWLGLRQGGRLPAVIGRFLLGLLPITALVLVYFLYDHALGDLFQVYFYDNIFRYSSLGGRGVFAMLWNVIYYTGVTLWNGRLYMGLSLLGMLWFLKAVRTALWETLAAWLAFGCMVFFVLFGGVYFPYYGLYFAAFSIFGLVALARALRWAAERCDISVPGAAAAALCVAAAAGSLAYANEYGRNEHWRQDRDTLPQYEFARIIQEEEDAALLYYGALDTGFYYAADQVPDVKYFSLLNVSLPEMYSEQDRYVREGVTDFVVVSGIGRQRFLENMRGYSLAAESGDYSLYRRD